MALPTLVTIEDIQVLCKYLATKPTGASLPDAKSVIDKKHLRAEKIAALKSWGILEKDAGKLKITSRGRKCAKSQNEMVAVLTQIIKETAPYNAIIERAAHKKEDSFSATDVASHWHNHFKSEVGDSDEVLNRQAVSFFQVSEGAKLGTIIIGRKGQPTRFSFSIDALKQFIQTKEFRDEQQDPGNNSKPDNQKIDNQITAEEIKSDITVFDNKKDFLGQAIFIAHGKNKKPLEQLKKILDQFKIPYKVAIEEPNLGRPISGKIREIMESCNCAILIFTADEEFKDKTGATIWRPSENVVFELGATGYLYDNRIVILKENGVTFPSNFRDIGYIDFEKDQLEAKTLDVIKELIGFGIVKVTT